MDTIVKEYKNDDITVVWKPDVCIHSRLCWQNLQQVFNPKARPWIDLSGSNTEQIIDQVRKCPSGALSYYKNESKLNIMEKTETTTLIEIRKNGPLICHGKIILKDAEGNEIVKENLTTFCRCGASKNKPFCDGNHRIVEFIG
jgi:uncharacterized Fe-S cluster protein YjdI